MLNFHLFQNTPFCLPPVLFQTQNWLPLLLKKYFYLPLLFQGTESKNFPAYHCWLQGTSPLSALSCWAPGPLVNLRYGPQFHWFNMSFSCSREARKHFVGPNFSAWSSTHLSIVSQCFPAYHTPLFFLLSHSFLLLSHFCWFLPICPTL